MKSCQNDRCIKNGCLLDYTANPDKCKLYILEKQRSAWELFQELWDDYRCMFFVVMNRLYNTSCASSKIVEWLIIKPEYLVIKILQKVKQELENG